MPRNNFKRYSDMAKAKVAEMAVRNDLVTLPPPQRAKIDKIKQGVNEMNCVEVGITFTQKIINAPDIALSKLIKSILIECLEGEGYGCFIHEYAHGRFHYHGILSDVSQKKLSTIRKQFELHIGRIEIKTISYYESYLRYMTKQICDSDHDEDLDFIV